MKLSPEGVPQTILEAEAEYANENKKGPSQVLVRGRGSSRRGSYNNHGNRQPQGTRQRVNSESERSKGERYNIQPFSIRFFWFSGWFSNRTGKCMLKVNIRNARPRCEICSK